jgi:CHAD domain-containing protein
MKKSQNTAIPVCGSCVFAMRRLLLQLDAFFLEMEGAKTEKNSEHIHQLRVASRRLRAALPICAPCVPEKRYRRWVDEIQDITRALSEARDADVQLEFLKKYQKKAAKYQGQDKRPPGADQPPIGDGIEYLLGIYRKKRSALQKQVLSAIIRMEKRRTIDDIRDAATGYLTAARRIRPRPAMYALPSLAADDVSRRLGTLLSYEPWLQYPEAISEHHAMRIAAKKLRYTMEFYAPMYRYGLRKPLFRIKKVQEMLGTIHDCDIWIDTVPRILLKERAEHHSLRSSEPRNPQIISDLKYFLCDREKKRKVLFFQLLQYWKNLERTRIWDEIRTALLTDIKKPFRPLPDPFPENLRDSVHQIALRYPDGQDHARHVTDLALELFDSLQPLHRMNQRARFLLECAGLLHDIGWTPGGKGHRRKGARMIFSFEQLPLDIIERGIIGLVALCHRGKCRLESQGYYTLLPADDRMVVSMLAALMRIADGLDATHQGIIQSLRCRVNQTEIICEVLASRDAETEKKSAISKSDLFVRVFGKPLVIRQVHSPSWIQLRNDERAGNN